MAESIRKAVFSEEGLLKKLLFLCNMVLFYIAGMEGYGIMTEKCFLKNMGGRRRFVSHRKKKTEGEGKVV